MHKMNNPLPRRNTRHDWWPVSYRLPQTSWFQTTNTYCLAICVGRNSRVGPGWSRLRVSHSLAVRLLLGAAGIWRLAWSWRIQRVSSPGWWQDASLPCSAGLSIGCLGGAVLKGRRIRFNFLKQEEYQRICRQIWKPYLPSELVLCLLPYLHLLSSILFLFS